MRAPAFVVVLLVACTRAPAQTPGERPSTRAAAEPTATAMPEAFEAENGRFGFRDANGREVLPARYLTAMPFDASGHAFVVDDQGWACIDTTGSVELRPFVFDNGPDYPSEGLFRYVDGGRIGFADLACTVVIPAAWEFAGPFAEQRAPVCRGCREVRGEHAMPQGGRWGFVDPTGREVIAATWDFVYPFEGGVARVERGGLPRRVAKDGTLVPTQAMVRVVQLDASDPQAAIGALRARREAMAGCADEHERVRPGVVAVARTPAPATGSLALAIAGDAMADRELATCLSTAVAGIAGVQQLVLRTGELPEESSLRAAPPGQWIGITDDGRCAWFTQFPCKPHKDCRAPERHATPCPELVPP